MAESVNVRLNWPLLALALKMKDVVWLCTKECRQPLGTGKGKEMDGFTPRESRKEHGSADTMILAQ